MAKESEQQTLRGKTIPVPKRGDVFRDLRKIAKADKPGSDAGERGAEDQQGE
jgi:hypothetical protein